MHRARVLFNRCGATGALFVELPLTPAEMQQGLMGRPSLAEDSGMLFDMGVEDEHWFHMNGVQFPIDFIFVAADGRIASILPGQLPGVLKVSGRARWIVEAPDGWAARRGLRVGSDVTFG